MKPSNKCTSISVKKPICFCPSSANLRFYYKYFFLYFFLQLIPYKRHTVCIKNNTSHSFKITVIESGTSQNYSFLLTANTFKYNHSSTTTKHYLKRDDTNLRWLFIINATTTTFFKNCQLNLKFWRTLVLTSLLSKVILCNSEYN